MSISKAQGQDLRGGGTTPRFPIVDVDELRTYLHEHPEIKVLVGMEFSGAIVQALLKQGIPAISVDLRAPEHQGPAFQGDVRDIVPMRHWEMLFLVGPNCYQHVRRDKTLHSKISDGRAFWGGAMVLWCVARPNADVVVVEQPDTIVYDYVRKEDLPGVEIVEIRTSQLGDTRDKFLRLAVRNGLLPPPEHAQPPPGPFQRRPSHREYPDDETRDRERSTWIHFPNTVDWLTNVRKVAESAHSIEYVELCRAWARRWAAAGHPLPADFDNPNAQPLDEESRRYQLVRGMGDGRSAQQTSTIQRVARRAEPGDQTVHTNKTTALLQLVDRLTKRGLPLTEGQRVKLEHATVPRDKGNMLFLRGAHASTGPRACLAMDYQGVPIKDDLIGDASFPDVDHYVQHAHALFAQSQDTTKNDGAEPRATRRGDERLAGLDALRWRTACVQVAERGVYLRIRQDNCARRSLLDTEGAELIYATPRDKHWGIGIDAELALVTPRCRWGRNEYGRALMRVRWRLPLELEPPMPLWMANALRAGAPGERDLPATFNLLQEALGASRRLEDCGGGGDCFPNTLAKVLNARDGHTSLTGERVRADTTRHAQQMVVNQTAWEDGEGPSVSATELIITSMASWAAEGENLTAEAWTEKMAIQGTWVDHAFLAMAADCFGVTIRYFAVASNGQLAHVGQIKPTPPRDTGATVEVALEVDQHYVAVVPIQNRAAGCGLPSLTELVRGRSDADLQGAVAASAALYVAEGRARAEEAIQEEATMMQVLEESLADERRRQTYDGFQPNDIEAPRCDECGDGLQDPACDNMPPTCGAWYCSRGGPPCFGGTNACECNDMQAAHRTSWTSSPAWPERCCEHRGVVVYSSKEDGVANQAAHGILDALYLGGSEMHLKHGAYDDMSTPAYLSESALHLGPEAGGSDGEEESRGVMSLDTSQQGAMPASAIVIDDVPATAVQRLIDIYQRRLVEDTLPVPYFAIHAVLSSGERMSKWTREQPNVLTVKVTSAMQQQIGAYMVSDVEDDEGSARDSWGELEAHPTRTPGPLVTRYGQHLGVVVYRGEPADDDDGKLASDAARYMLELTQEEAWCSHKWDRRTVTYLRESDFVVGTTEAPTARSDDDMADHGTGRPRALATAVIIDDVPTRGFDHMLTAYKGRVMDGALDDRDFTLHVALAPGEPMPTIDDWDGRIVRTLNITHEVLEELAREADTLEPSDDETQDGDQEDAKQGSPAGRLEHDGAQDATHAATEATGSPQRDENAIRSRRRPLPLVNEEEVCERTVLIVPYAIDERGTPMVMQPPSTHQAFGFQAQATERLNQEPVVTRCESLVRTALEEHEEAASGFLGGANHSDRGRVVVVPVARREHTRMTTTQRTATTAVWCGLAMLSCGPGYLTAAKLGVTVASHFIAHDETTTSMLKNEARLREDSNLREGRTGYMAPHRPHLQHGDAVTPRQLLERAAQSLYDLKEALGEYTGKYQEYCRVWADAIKPLKVNDLSPKLFDEPIRVGDPQLGRHLFSRPLPVYETPWLHRMPRQRWKAQPGCEDYVAHRANDLLSQEAINKLSRWRSQATMDMACLEEKGAGCDRKEKPQAIAIGQSEFHPCARGYVWDCRSPPCRLLEYAEPISTSWDLEYLRGRLRSYPDQRLASNVLEGIRLEADLELTAVFSPHLVSIGNGYDSVQKTVRELKDRGFYEFFVDAPYMPMVVVGQGSRIKKLGTDKYRRTSDFSGPHKVVLDGAGQQVTPINEASKSYYVPNWIKHSDRDDVRAWAEAKYSHVPATGEEKVASPKHKFPKEKKPFLGDVMGDIAILLYAAMLLQEPIFVWVEDAAFYFNQFGYASEELWKSNLVVNARPEDIDQEGSAFNPGQLVFVTEKRLGFGSYASSNLAQRFSNAVIGWTLEEFDELEELARDGTQDPKWDEWVESRAQLEPLCRRQRPKTTGEALSDCKQTRLAALYMYTDDPVAICVGVARTIRLLEAWHTVTGGINIEMAGAEKRQLGGDVEWIGVALLVALGLVAIPKDKLLRARDAILRTLDQRITFGEYRALVGLLEHLRFVAQISSDVTNALYAPHGRGGESREGPSTTIRPTKLMQDKLSRWLRIIMGCAGAPVTIVFSQSAEERLKEAETLISTSSDAAGDGRGTPGIGGYTHGFYWRVHLCPEVLPLLHITAWETLAACINILVAARISGKRVTLAAHVDALLTPYVLSHQKSTSVDVQTIIHELLHHPTYSTSIAARLLLRHLSGDGNVPADLVSRGLWDELKNLAGALKVRLTLVSLDRSERALLRRVVLDAASRRQTTVDNCKIDENILDVSHRVVEDQKNTAQERIEEGQPSTERHHQLGTNRNRQDTTRNAHATSAVIRGFGKRFRSDITGDGHGGQRPLERVGDDTTQVRPAARDGESIGHGLFSARAILQGELVAIFGRGRMVTQEQWDEFAPRRGMPDWACFESARHNARGRRYKIYDETWATNLPERDDTEATRPKWSYVNHSRYAPNCEAVIPAGNDLDISFVATRGILPGEELTFNYGAHTEDWDLDEFRRRYEGGGLRSARRVTGVFQGTDWIRVDAARRRANFALVSDSDDSDDSEQNEQHLVLLENAESPPPGSLVAPPPNETDEQRARRLEDERMESTNHHVVGVRLASRQTRAAFRHSRGRLAIMPWILLSMCGPTHAATRQGRTSSSPLRQEVIQNMFVPVWATQGVNSSQTAAVPMVFRPTWARAITEAVTGNASQGPTRLGKGGRTLGSHPYMVPAYGTSTLRGDQQEYAKAFAQRLANDRTPGRIEAPLTQLEDMAMAVAEARADGVNPRTASKDQFALREFTAFAELSGFDPNLRTEWTKRFPEREQLKLASFLLFRAQRAVPRSKKDTVAKPMSIYQNYLALRRVFRARDVELPASGSVRETLKGLLRRFVRRFGVDNLRPKRVEPVTPDIVKKVLDMAQSGTHKVKGIIWSYTNWLCFIVMAWMVINLSVGSRKAESTKLRGDVDENDWFTRASVTYEIKGRTYVDPPEHALESMAEGDTAALSPKGSKCDQYGTCHGTEPIILPFHDDPLNAARWLRDIERRWPVHGEHRRRLPLFCTAVGQPFDDATFAAYIMAALTEVLGENRAKLLSPHSWRVWLASSLRMCGASDARIQAFGRWLNPESIKIYARITKTEYAQWVDRLMSIRKIDTARTTSLPVMDFADAMAAWGDQLKFEEHHGSWGDDNDEANAVVAPSPLKRGDRISVHWTELREWFSGTFQNSKVEQADHGGKQRASRVVYDAVGPWAQCNEKDLTYWHCLDDEHWKLL